MSMDWEEFDRLIKDIEENRAGPVLNLVQTVDAKQIITITSKLQTNTSVKSLIINGFSVKGTDLATAIVNILKVNKTLQNLSLNQTMLGDEGIKILAPAINQSQLSSLNLENANIGVEGIKALVPAIEGSRVLHLNLAGNKIGVQGIELLTAIIKKQLLSLSLKRLQLPKEMSEDEANILAVALKESQLRYLDLSSNRFNSEGIKILSTAIQSSKIGNLDLSNNNLGPERIPGLVSLIQTGPLQYLNLSGNRLGDEGVAILSTALQKSTLLSLDLMNNDIGVDGIKKLAAALQTSQLKILELSNNRIEGEAAKILQEVIKSSNLWRLGLQNNRVRDEGMKALLGATQIDQTSKLKSLNLAGNYVSNDAIQALKDTIHTNRLVSFDVMGNASMGLTFSAMKKQLDRIIMKIQENLKILASQFQALLSPPIEIPLLLRNTYTQQCKELFTMAKSWLQVLEILNLPGIGYYTQIKINNESWQLLLWQCLDKMPLLDEKREVAALFYTWVDVKEEVFTQLALETQDSAEIQDVVVSAQRLQTGSKEELAEIQKILLHQEQELNRKFAEKAQDLEKRIEKLERDREPKSNKDQAIEEELVSLKAQQRELAERQIDPVLLINQFESISQKIETEEQILNTLRTQLQQKFTALETETVEERQRRTKEILHHTDQLNKCFELQLADLNKRIEELKKEHATETQSQKDTLSQLQEEYSKLRETYQQKQKILAKKQYFDSIDSLRFFYRSVQVKLQELFIAYKGLDSGMLQSAQFKVADKIATGIQLAGDWIPLPYSSEIAGVFSTLLQRHSDKQKKNHAAIITYLAVSFKEIDQLSEETARILTERYEEQLHCLTPSGAKLLGDCAVKYMLAFMTGNQLKHDEPLASQFVYSVLTLDISNGWWPKTHKDIPCKTFVSGWTDHGIFKHPGIKTENQEFFSREDTQHTKAHKYGYRLGTKEEALKAGLIKTSERVSSSVPTSDKLTPAGHKQVTAITVVAQGQGEQLERMQKQLQQIYDLRAEDLKKMSEMQIQLEKQQRENEALKSQVQSLFTQFNDFKLTKTPATTTQIERLSHSSAT